MYFITKLAMKTLNHEQYQDKISKLKTLDDLNNFAKELIAPVLQEMLEGEMENHLGYPKHSPAGRNTGNSRNGYSHKTLKSKYGEMELSVPRDRKGDFEPEAVRKYQTIDNAVEEKIISMYAKGMSTRDINAHMQDIYGVDVSSTMVSSITDKVLPLLAEWQDRPLPSLYAVLYLDGIHFKVRDNGRIVNKCCYTVLGLNMEGKKEVLGLWVMETEGAKFWMSVLTDLRNRGTEDVLIACTDGLKGFKEAIAAVFPQAVLQRCIVHQVRNTMKYTASKHLKEFCNDLKSIYRAPSEEAGLKALEAVKEKWPQYKLHLQRWEQDWPELSVFFLFSPEVRRLIYTTNPVESLHRQMRKVTKTTSVFPHDESLKKLLFLAHQDISKKWTMSVQNWGLIISQLAIEFPDRVKL